MKIFILPSSYPSETNSTKQIFVYEQAKVLAEKGYDIVVLHVEKLPSNQILKKVDQEIRVVDDGFCKRYTVYQKTFCAERFLKKDRKDFVRSMKKLFEKALRYEGKPDLLYAHFSCWAGLAATEISKMYNIPLIVMEHFGGLLSSNVKEEYKSAVIKCVSNSKKFLCVSENLKNAVTKIVGNSENISVVDRKSVV